MENLKHYEEVMQQIPAITEGLLSDNGTAEQKKKLDGFKQVLEKNQYVKIPLIGIFSAGKSTLLNAFLEKPDLLPIDIDPETAIAYELYYSNYEHIEHYRDDKLIDEKPLDKIKELNTAPGDVAKVYVKNLTLRDLNERNIVLVDMPGIGSGIEKHELAIMHYLQEGAEFILVADVEQGTLRTSTLNFLIEELSKYKITPALLVSKVDKKTAEDVELVRDEMAYQMRRICGSDVYVATVSAANNDTKGLSDFLNGVNTKSIVEKRVGSALNAIIDSIIAELKLRIEVRSKDIQDIDAAIAEMEKQMDDVHIQDVIDNAQTESPQQTTADILERVRFALVGKSEDIARLVVQKASENKINSAIISVIRPEIVLGLKEEIEQYASNLGAVVQSAMATSMYNINFGGNLYEDNKEAFDLLLDQVVVMIPPQYGGPIIQMLLPVIKEFLRVLFGKSEAEQVAEARSEFLHSCLPTILNDLQTNVYKMVCQQQQCVQEQLARDIKERAEATIAALQTKKEDSQKNKTEVQGELAQLATAVEQMEQLKNK